MVSKDIFAIFIHSVKLPPPDRLGEGEAPQFFGLRAVLMPKLQSLPLDMPINNW